MVLSPSGIMLATAGFSLLLCVLLAPMAQRIGLLDHPSERTVHKNPTPLVGGLAIYRICISHLPGNGRAVTGRVPDGYWHQPFGHCARVWVFYVVAALFKAPSPVRRSIYTGIIQWITSLLVKNYGGRDE